MYTHFQNLVKNGGSSYPVHVRGSMSASVHSMASIGFELAIYWGFRLGITLDTERDLTFNVHFLFINFYLILGNILPAKCYPTYGAPCFDVYVHQWSIWLTLPKLWQDYFDSNYSFCFSVPDFFLGDVKVNYERLSKEHLGVAFPEKTYNVTATRRRVTRKRPRWFEESFIAVDLDCEDGIPIPGKGESSHDCGDTATYSYYAPNSTIKDAVSKLMKSVSERRRKYGSGDNMYVERKPDYGKTAWD